MSSQRENTHRRVARVRALWVVMVVVALVAAACSSGSGDSGDDVEPRSRRSAPLDTGDASAPADTSASRSNAASAEGSDTTAASRRDDDGVTCGAVAAQPSGPSVVATSVDVGGMQVELAHYPRPAYEGDPWTHWGQGVVLSDGRFVSGIGDHLGADGNSYVYVYDPATSELTQVGDVASAIGQQTGEWGQGKIHAQMVLGACDEVLMATYWGKRTDGPGVYEGGHILSFDTTDYGLRSIGIPAPGFGIPSLAEKDGLLYGEGADPAAPRGTDRGVFFVFDPATGETVFAEESSLHDRFRSVLLTSDGGALIATSDQRLLEYQQGGSLAVSDESVPVGWLRAVSPAGADGTVYGVTKDPEGFFARSSDGNIVSLGTARGYTTSLALDANGRVLYVPDAHGDAWEHDATLYAFDPATGVDVGLVGLNSAAEQALGLTLGGTYSVTTSPDGSTVYVVFNAGSRDDPWGEVVLAVVHL